MKIFLPTRKGLIPWLAWMVFIGLTSCYKNAIENYAEEEFIVEDVATGIREADDALEVAYYAEALQRTANGRRAASVCGEIIYDPANKIIIIDYGDSACFGLFARSRQGKIIVNYANELSDSLSDKSVTFENYLVSGRKVSGTVSLHDFSFDKDSAIVAIRTLTDFSVEFSNNLSITFNGSQSRTWTSGRGDALLTNNVYSLVGSMNGVTSSGRTFQQDITVAVLVNFYCASLNFFPYTLGMVELSQLKGYPNRKRTVDYGIGTCDLTMSVETFRRTYGVTIF